MHEPINISELINRLQTSEGDSFSCNRTQIEKSVSKRPAVESGIIIKILIVFGGILSSSFFLMFVFSFGLNKTPAGMLINGLFYIYGAIWLYKISSQLIFETICISFFITGFLLLAIALNQYHLTNTVCCLIYCITAATTLLLTRNYLMVFASILNIFGSILTCIVLNKAYWMFQLYNPVLAGLLTFFCFKEAAFVTGYRSISELYNPIRLGLIFAFLMGMIMVSGDELFPEGRQLIWVSSFANSIILYFLLQQILPVFGVVKTQSKLLIYSVCILLLLSLAWAPSVSGAILVMLICFMVNERAGAIAGIVAGIYFIAQFYYDLQYTLLIKSVIMFCTGLLFFLFYFITPKTKLLDEEV